MTSSKVSASWSYLNMPQRRLRMALYTRESDYRLANSTTIESAALAAREHGERQGYIYDPELDFREAISSVEVPYMHRQRLQDMLDAGRRGLFDVLVVTEIRTISRRQVEVLVIYDQLQKYGVKLETIKEKFGEDAMSKAILSLRAMFVEVEVEQSKMRMERGKRDRVIIGHAPKVAVPTYTHFLVDTEREVKGRYVLNTQLAYVDPEGKEWTRIDVAKFFCDLLAKGGSLRKACHILNDMGIPSDRGTLWVPGTLRCIVNNPILYGQPYANRYERVETKTPRGGRKAYHQRIRPQEEWMPLPPCEPVITRETFDLIQFQLAANRAESMRNNQLQEPGLVRSGYCVCGICGRAMIVGPASKSSFSSIPHYGCRRKTGEKADLLHNHRTTISVRVIDIAVKQKIAEVLTHPDVIRQKVDDMRKELKQVIDKYSVTQTLAEIAAEIKNFLELARHATTSSMITSLAQQMNQLEDQKRWAEKLLFAIEDDEAKKAAIEAELVKFEAWADTVRPFLTNPAYLEAATYDELRLAVRIIGIKVTVLPTIGEWEYRYKIDVTLPEIAKKIYEEEESFVTEGSRGRRSRARG